MDIVNDRKIDSEEFLKKLKENEDADKAALERVNNSPSLQAKVILAVFSKLMSPMLENYLHNAISRGSTTQYYPITYRMSDITTQKIESL